MATGVSAIAMGTGHPGAEPAGGGERRGSSADSRPGPWGGSRGWALRESGGTGSPESNTTETLLRRLLFHAAAGRLLPARWGEGSVTEPPPRLGERALRHSPSAGRLRETLEANWGCPGATRGPQTALEGRGRPVGAGGAGRCAPQGREEAECVRLECLWGLRLGAPGLRIPLPPGEGPEPFQ